MKNKIDISSLNAETKKKIKQYHKRCCDLDDIVYKPFEINIKFKVGAIWSEGLTARAVGNDEFEIAAMEIRKIRKKYIKEVNKEIKEIIKFSKKVAKKLDVDEKEFFSQYLCASATAW